MGGGGTQVISASGYGAVQKAFTDYREKIGTFYVSVGGMRGALNEDWCDMFAWATEEGEDKAEDAIKLVVQESISSGLTEKIEKFLGKK